MAVNMSRSIQTIGFDADDTLWHNETFFQLTQDRFAELLADYAEQDHLRARLLEAERRNLGAYGFGIKGFTLSMIETALEVTDNRVPGEVIAELIDVGKDMLNHPIELLPGAQEAVEALAPDFTLILITKGDLLHQERKLAQSGLGDLFDGVEIVSDKSVDVYLDIFSGRSIQAVRALMAGNSLKSDVNPFIDAGGWGAYLPQDLAWDFEAAAAPTDHPRFRQVDGIKKLPGVVTEICRKM